MTIGEKLKSLRKKRGYTQQAVAEALGVDQTLISKIEDNSRNVTVGILKKLSDIYCCTFESLLLDECCADALETTLCVKNPTPSDLINIQNANKIMLNLKEMIDIKNKENKNE